MSQSKTQTLIERLHADAAEWDLATMSGAAETRVLLREAAAELTRLSAEKAEESAIVDRVWKALGVEKYEDAKGMSIDELVAQNRAALLQAREEILLSRDLRHYVRHHEYCGSMPKWSKKECPCGLQQILERSARQAEPQEGEKG